MQLFDQFSFYRLTFFTHNNKQLGLVHVRQHRLTYKRNVQITRDARIFTDSVLKTANKNTPVLFLNPILPNMN